MEPNNKIAVYYFCGGGVYINLHIYIYIYYTHIAYFIRRIRILLRMLPTVDLIGHVGAGGAADCTCAGDNSVESRHRIDGS